MQLPSQYHAFHEPTMIVVTNSVKAKLCLAHDQMIEVLQEINVSEELEQMAGDKEAYPGSEDRPNEKQHVTEDHLYPALSKALMQRLQNQEFKQLIFTVPEELEKTLKESLHTDLLKHASLFLPKNLMQQDLLEVVTEIQENF